MPSITDLLLKIKRRGGGGMVEIVKSASPRPKISDPRQREMLDEMKRVDAAAFKAPVVTWSPDITVAEQSFDHQLGEIPTGIYLVEQEVPLHWYVTSAQKERWTDKKVFFYTSGAFRLDSGVGAVSTGVSSTTLDFNIPIDRDIVGISYSMRLQATAFAGAVPLKIEALYDDVGGTGNVNTRPYKSMTLNTHDELNLSAGGTLRFVWELTSQLEDSDVFRWAVV